MAHAPILLNADEGNPDGGLLDADIASAVEVSIATVERVHRRFVELGLSVALERKRSERTYARRSDGAAEARLVMVACGESPASAARWTLRLLADACPSWRLWKRSLTKRSARRFTPTIPSLGESAVVHRPNLTLPNAQTSPSNAPLRLPERLKI